MSSFPMYFSICLMILVPQMSFIDGNPMLVEKSQPQKRYLKARERCQNQIKVCACGADSSEYMSVAIKMCPYDDPMTKKPTCKPCNDSSYHDTCKKYKCETCSSQSCMACPQGKTGEFCAENVKDNELTRNSTSMPNFPIRVRIPMGDPDGQHRMLRAKTGCDFHPMETSELNCFLYDSRVTCDQKCIWGHRLMDQERSRSYECTYRAKQWTPSNIVDCEKYIDCGISLVSNGKIACTVGDPKFPDQCLISCLTYDEDDGGDIPEALYICDEFGNYNPPLPYCVKLNRTLSNRGTIF